MPTRFGNLRQRTDLKKSIGSTEAILNNPYLSQSMKYKEEARRQLAKEKAQLEAMSPPPCETEGRRKYLATRERQLQEAMLLGNQRKGIPPMPTRRMMQENPSGSTGKHMRWEKNWKGNTIDDKGNMIPAANGRGAIFEWKDVRRELHQNVEVDDPDIANIETFRPDNDQVPLADQHSPRSYGLSMAAKENFDRVFPDREPTPVEKKLEESAAITTWDRCQATTKKGGTCGMRTKEGQPFCWQPLHKKQFEKPPEA